MASVPIAHLAVEVLSLIDKDKMCDYVLLASELSIDMEQ